MTTTTDRPLPPVTDRATWQARIDELRVREKAHTRAGDALAAERRRLPMVEVDPQTTLIGADGPVPLIEVFEGRSQLLVYFLMWHTGKPAVGDPDAGFLVSYLRDGDRVYETYRNAARGNEVMGSSYPMLDLTVYGRQESWEDSPEGWPQRLSASGGQMTLDGRPTAQWPRLAAGRSDDLGPAGH